jgi:hypothetical protein
VSDGTPKHPIRIPLERWRRFGEICTREGTDRTKDLNAYIERRIAEAERGEQGGE